MSRKIKPQLGKGKHPCDRFIPYRRGLDIERANHALTRKQTECGSQTLHQNPPIVPINNQDRCPYRDRLDEVFGVKHKSRIFSFSPYHSRENSTRNNSTLRKRTPPINWIKEASLDLPGLQDDFYTNTLDWSSRDVIVVGLGRLVAMRNVSQNEDINVNIDLSTPTSIVSSLAWDQPGEQLVLGSSRGEILLLTIDQQATKMYSSKVDASQSWIGALTWSGNVFMSGSKAGVISILDPRCSSQITARLKCHNNEICSLKTSEDGQLLACGSENGELVIWDIGERKIYQRIKAHKSANKALAWVPFKRRTIVTGGGVQDGCLKIWNVNDQHLLFEHNTGCQISSVVWSTEHMALMTGHGVPTREGNDILLWRWKETNPLLEYVSSMKAHKARILHMAVSPDGNHLASAGADENLLLWKLSSSRRRNSCGTSFLDPAIR